jgi:anti-sigma B factor antagonist
MFRVEPVSPGVVKLVGRLDASEAEPALKAFSKFSESTVADCAALEYISSAGIGVLMQTYKRLFDLGFTLRLTNVSPRIRNVFGYAGLSGLLGIE